MQDRTISPFARGQQPAFAGINTFIKSPYCENIRDVGKYDVAIVGAPFDMGTTYRAGCRFGPQAVRRISALYDSYNADMGVDLYEELNLCDAGDIFVIPSNIEKSFDQIDNAVSFIHKQGDVPGGDRRRPLDRLSRRAGDRAPHRGRALGSSTSTATSTCRNVTWTSGCTPRRGSMRPNIPNAPARNLVQMGIGGWYGSRPGMKVARDRG